MSYEKPTVTVFMPMADSDMDMNELFSQMTDVMLSRANTDLGLWGVWSVWDVWAVCQFWGVCWTLCWDVCFSIGI